MTTTITTREFASGEDVMHTAGGDKFAVPQASEDRWWRGS